MLKFKLYFHIFAFVAIIAAAASAQEEQASEKPNADESSKASSAQEEPAVGDGDNSEKDALKEVIDQLRAKARKHIQSFEERADKAYESGKRIVQLNPQESNFLQSILKNVKSY